MLLPTNLTALAYDKTSKEPPGSTERVEQLKDSGPETVQSEEPVDPDEEITAIVILETQPVVTESNGSRQVQNRAAMLRQQAAIQKEISKNVLDGASVEIIHNYTSAANGFAMKVAYGKLDEIRALPGVASAYPAPEFKVAPDMETKTTELGGLENSSGYQGEGMVIAIVDSGLQIDHKSFKKAPNDPALTQKDIESVLAGKQLHAEEKKPGITASQVYRTAKVPFAFDYADNDLDVNPGNAGDHGTHVAGIAAANADVVADVVGVAPQAQILAMKVFSSSGSNGATWDDILAAADDAVSLGADVINMSLGSTCGFSTPEGDEGVAEVFQNIADSGVMLSISAGNEYSAALGTQIGKGHALTSNPDYGTVASPSSYSGPLSVASVEKADTITSNYLTSGERKIAFNDTAEDSTASGVDTSSKKFRSLAGETKEYVVVPNFGAIDDYKDLNVKGKIALVSRGASSYQEKKEAAKTAGVIGMLVYNNEPGMLYMQLDQYDLPTAFISQADGKYLMANAGNGAKLTVSATTGSVDNPTSGEMSDFSSWGVTPELTLKPDITAPGGNIKSTTVNNGYTTKSGTSMSAPFVSGAMALVKQYIEQKNYASGETEKAALVSDLLMSTADLVMAGNAPYSPRKQGAGSVNITAATSSKAYLTAAGGGLPKVELGDDANKTGSYTVTFQVHNLTDETLNYTAGGYIQTDGQEVTKQLDDKDVHQVTELPYLLGKIASQSVSVPANGTATVTIPVTLTEENRAYLDTFENGAYIEGFVTLTPESDVQPALSIPYMGFYGDWTKAPIIDATDYGDKLNGQTDWSQAYVNTAASSSLEGTVNTYLGDNPYHDGQPYSSERNAISPNGDDYMDSLSFVYTGMLRNVKALKYEIKDAATGEVYYDNTVDYETKSVYSSNYYQIVPSGASDYNKFSWNGTKKDGYSKVPNGTKVIVTVSGELAYDRHAAHNKKSSWSFPITIDTEEPEASNITVSNENGKYYVNLKVTDDQFVSNVTISNNAESKELASFPITEENAGAVTERKYDITGFGENLKVVVNDYACNRKVYSIKAEGNTDASEVIVPTKTVLNEDFEETSFPPEGWSLKTTVADKTWYQGTEHGSKMAMVDLSKSEQQDEWLITPDIDLKAQDTKAGMIFDLYTNYYWSVQTHHHNLKVMASTNGTDWEQIWQLWDWNQKNEFGPWEKTQAKVTIPDKFQDADNVKFAFVYEGKDSTSLWLDNVQVYVEDPSQVHTITATAGEGGSIDPSGSVQIADGKSRTFTITPDEGYFIQNVEGDGDSIGTPASYTFSEVTADHTIKVTFGGGSAGESELLIDQNFDACKSNGALPDGWSASGSMGSSKTWVPYQYPYSPAAFKGSLGAYRTDDYNYDGVEDDRLVTPVVDMTNRTASMSFRFIAANHYIKQGQFTCYLEATTDGKNWTELWKSEYDSKTYLNADSSGYQVYTDVNVLIPEALQTNNVQFAFRYQKKAGGSGVCSIDDVKLIATKASQSGGEVKPEVYTITASAGQGGSIDPNGAVSVSKGGSQTFTITPSENYEIKDVIVDGASVGVKSTYTFENVTKAHTIDATFSEKAVTLPDSIHEDFNSGSLPAGWKVEGPSAKDKYESWKIDRYTDWRSNAAICAANYMGSTAQNEMLIMPQINMKNSMQLSFDFAASYAQLSSDALKLTVKASLDKGQTWTEIWNAKEHMGDIDEENTPEDVTGKGSISIPSNFCKDGAQFAFVFESAARTGARAAIDNVNFAAGTAPAPVARYGITIAPMQNGAVTADKSTAAEGETVTLTVKPDDGYHLKDGSLMANNQLVNGNAFKMPASEVTVTALFEKDAAVPSTGKYKDGVYTGSAIGYDNGTVSVKVTVENGRIKDIDVSQQKQTEEYWKKALDTIKALLGLGDDAAVAAVDTKTGATVSSTAIKEAVQKALRSAKEADGSKNDPYVISDIEQLQQFAEAVNAGNDYAGKYVALGCDLNLSGIIWTPIGTSDHGKTTGFAGTFDGRGYTISHVNCGSGSTPTKYEADGFFGVVSGTICDLNVQIDKFYNDYDAENDYTYAGGLVGLLENNGIIDHCSVTGGNQAFSINSSTKAAIGGLVGLMRSGSMVANSWSDIGLNYGTISPDNADVYMGGICGRQDQNSLIANSASFGSVPGTIINGTIRVGGLVGYTGGAIYNCYTNSVTKLNNILGVSAGTVVPSIGHLIGGAENGAALYQCYYDKNADQFGNTDLAGDPSEGKTERRQAVGRDSDSDPFPDTEFVKARTATELASDDFAKELNDNQKNSVKEAADAYFKAKDLLTSRIVDLEDKLDDRFLKWKLTDGRVLFGDKQIEKVSITDVELLKQRTVDNGTSQAELNLPETVEVTLSDRTKADLGVRWECSSYDGNTAGSYTFEGTLALTNSITNPKSIKAYVVVIVRSADQPVTKFQVTVTGGSGSGSYAPGEKVTIKADAPASGYTFNGWTADGVTLADSSANTTTFVMPEKNVKISANWKSTGSTSGGGSSSGGGGGSSTSNTKYSISLPDSTANGTVTVDPKSAAKGATVTVTVSPDKDYELGDLTVTDNNGKKITVTKKNDNKYTFTMPEGKVTVKADFKKTEKSDAGNGFADVPDNAYYSAAVKWAVEKKITNGTADKTFSPDKTCTRAEIVTFLWRAAGSPKAKGSGGFSDVAANSYYAEAVAWAVENGITSGIGNGRFDSDAICTRAQAVTFLCRATGKAIAYNGAFSDVSNNAYYAGSVAWASENDVTKGVSDGRFAPDTSCTRAQIVSFIYRAYQNK